MVKTKDMSLRVYLSTLSFQPKQAEALEKLFSLAEGWRKAASGDNADAANIMTRACANDLNEVLDS